MEEIINHQEAEELALLKREESNLARCYLDLKAQNDKLRAQVLTNCVDNLPEGSVLVKADKWEALKLRIEEARKAFELVHEAAHSDEWHGMPGVQREAWNAVNKFLEIQDDLPKKEYSVGQQVSPGLIVVHEDTLAQMSQSLTMIHDLAGQLGNHPHAGAIQAWVHKVMPCGRKCPHSGVFRGEKCGACGEEVR